MANNDMSQYRGKRALILTRVSTPKQEEKYSHAAQLRQVREKLIIPLGLRVVDEKKHIIHDTYSGLEYRYRKALDDILEMAERQEFDVLCMDVLDRGLGRRALARELFRMQLKELGISILTTQESDHADDDSLEGQIMRFFKGVKAEEEINDFVRRSRDGKREKTLGDAEKPGQVLGTGMRLYGYQFVLNEKGVRVGYAPNDTIIYVEADGTECTEAKVVIFIFESAARGVSTHQLARTFNEKGIPTSYAFRGKRNKGMREDSVWQRNTISQILKNTAYYGEYRQFKTVTVGRRPGSNRPMKQKTPEDKQETRKIKLLRDAITRVQKIACCVQGSQNARVAGKPCMYGTVILKCQQRKAPTIITIAGIRNSRGVVSVQVVVSLSISLIVVLQSTFLSLFVTSQKLTRRYSNCKPRTPRRNNSNESSKTSTPFCANRKHFGTTWLRRCVKKRSANEPSRF
jgi:DNA invertase Pin-like site-specific DNA recombinase